jgi:hypothetical protein
MLTSSTCPYETLMVLPPTCQCSLTGKFDERGTELMLISVVHYKPRPKANYVAALRSGSIGR